jgi:DNA polymerase-4
MILHVDMDAFYASVEERERPELIGKPVIVGGTPEGRGVVAAANYVARRFGVHSAMPAATAKRLCPHAVFLASRMGFYAQVSQQIREILHRYTPLVEPLSLDEAFLDVTGSRRLFGAADEIGQRIKQEIRGALQLVASVGVAPNKFLAKIASDLDKPDGFVVVEPDRVEQFLGPLPVERLWGVGAVAAKRLHARGIRTIGQLAGEAADVLRSAFGSAGDGLWRLAHGIDNRPVVPYHRAKSISQETTFATDITERGAIRSWLLDLTDQVARRLRRHGLLARCVHVKMRFSDFRTITRSHTLAEATDVTRELWRAVAGMLDGRVAAELPPVRLLGVGLSGLGSPGHRQGGLFEEREHARQRQLDETADRIKKRFGTGALGRGSGLSQLPPG